MVLWVRLGGRSPTGLFCLKIFNNTFEKFIDAHAYCIVSMHNLTMPMCDVTILLRNLTVRMHILKGNLPILTSRIDLFT